jgi:membrane dipeptidase
MDLPRRQRLQAARKALLATTSAGSHVNGSLSSGIGRREMIASALCLLAAPWQARAQSPRVSIADMHSHLGMMGKPFPSPPLAEAMRAQQVALVTWALAGDIRWIRQTDAGVAQVSIPEPGALASFFGKFLDRMRAYIAEARLRTVLTPQDVDACVAGDAGVVLAAEGADFLEGRLGGLDSLIDKGLRHVQLVHYIQNPVGDFQTVAPTHSGLTDFGRSLVEACNAKGVLVDLAHLTGDGITQALAISKAPVVFSHGWVDNVEGDWKDGIGVLQRRLSLAHAKKIAAAGGVVGLWGLGLQSPGPSRLPGQGNWTVARGDTRGYARELASLVDRLGEDHVALGTDLHGVGADWSVNDYGHVRKVVESLQDMKLASSVVEKVAYGNYVRVLKTAMSTRRS